MATLTVSQPDRNSPFRKPLLPNLKKMRLCNKKKNCEVNKIELFRDGFVTTIRPDNHRYLRRPRRTMSVQYKRFLKLLEKWPIDKSKSGRYVSS